MNLQQTAAVLALIAVVDHRRIDEAVVLHWHDLIGDLDYGDALAAVREHRRESPEYLLPVHVRDRVAVYRRDRLGKVDVEAELAASGMDPDDPAWFRELRARQAAIRDGAAVPAQIESRP